jgi:phosphomecalonate degydratase large subunit
MRLTKAQHHLREQGSEAQRQAMRILLALAKISDADRLIPITGAHVSGASYKMIGDPGLEFLEDAARDARVVVPTTVNPLGTDLRQWRDLAIPPEFAAKQERIAAAYERMGVHPIYSCTPYHVGTRPVFGEHVAWAESNAVCFANSVLGARTNRESGPSALAAAIVGATPEYGRPPRASPTESATMSTRAWTTTGSCISGSTSSPPSKDGSNWRRMRMRSTCA